MSSRSRRPAALIVVASCALGTPAAPGFGGPGEAAPIGPPPLDVLMAYMHFDAAAQKKLLAGEVIAGTIDEKTDRELAVSVAMLETRPLDAVLKTIHDLRDLENTEFHLLSEPPDDSGFAAAGFTPKQAHEAGELLRAKPGSDFNLSAAEYQALAALAQELGKGAEKTPEGLEAIGEQERQFLRDRYAAYRAQGIAGIA